ncbi:CMRF35-like molecule 1 [Talpa occidentalis]|uniref:CMRF35-like molecule 1 n=1 Tax=Talpa occidentalis TaxID=50954 RepID=UPI00188FFFF8|nr:CMRF35-like molecule 1 [Talpa occidentalis]
MGVYVNLGAVIAQGQPLCVSDSELCLRCWSRGFAQWDETHKKWWCRGAAWFSCNILVTTTGSEQEVRNGSVSIRDHQKNHTFTVTMEALTLGDADTYWEIVTKILPVVAAVLLLVLTAASLLAWRLVRRQRKASGISPEQEMFPVQAPESELCYANLALHRTGTTRREASAQVEVQVEYITAGCAKEDVTYAALTLGALGQEPTYSNTEQLVTHIPRSSQEEPVEYSTVRRH